MQFSIERIDQTILNDVMQAKISIDGLRVPNPHLIGEQGRGFELVMDFLNTRIIRKTVQGAGLMQILEKAPEIQSKTIARGVGL